MGETIVTDEETLIKQLVESGIVKSESEALKLLSASSSISIRLPLLYIYLYKRLSDSEKKALKEIIQRIIIGLALGLEIANFKVEERTIAIHIDWNPSDLLKRQEAEARMIVNALEEIQRKQQQAKTPAPVSHAPVSREPETPVPEEPVEESVEVEAEPVSPLDKYKQIEAEGGEPIPRNEIEKEIMKLKRKISF